MTMTKLAAGLLLGGAAMFAVATAHADPITFAPDWPNHQAQTMYTICAALAQGWSRAQIVDAAEHASNTGMSVVQAAQLADSMIEAAR